MLPDPFPHVADEFCSSSSLAIAIVFLAVRR
jgi:hypothetical protein